MDPPFPDELSVRLRGLADASVPTDVDRVYRAVAERLELESSPRSIGRFEIRRRIGAGGMGIVFEARDPRLDRTVAVKLLRSPGRDGQARARLEREARVLARLRHPNVVAVYELGTHDDQLFVAMEYVEGGSLRDRLRDQPRRWSQVLAWFLAAGRGLAAAHRAGIVHRDFKPANVLVGADGRAQVADFGLAREGEPPSVVTDPSQTWADVEDEASLTRTGAIMGTPAYMAPEVLAGHRADARSDQFSFCVSLHEALFGSLPFPPRSLALGLPTKLVMPRASDVPRWVRRALRRGLALEPGARWPDMAALLRALERRRPWGRIAAVGGAMAGATAIGLLWAPAPRCAETDDPLAGAWDEARRRAVRMAFERTGVPYAGPAWANTEARLDAYAATWRAMAVDACRAALERHEQSDEVFDRRMQCLGRRRDELRALVERFELADRDVVARAVASASSLVSISACADIDALLAARALPDDLLLRAEVERLRGGLARVRAMRDTGAGAEAMASFEALDEAIQATDYDPLRAEAMLDLATLQDQAGDPRASAETLREVFALAQRIGDDETASWAAIIGVHVAASSLHDPAEARLWAWLAEPFVQRGETEERKRATYWLHLGSLELREGNPEQAGRTWERARDTFSRSLGPDHPRVGQTLNNLGIAYASQGRHRDALRVHLEAERALASLYGDAHPMLAGVHNSIGVRYAELGELDEAERRYRRALELWDGPPPQPSGAHALTNLGELRAERGDHRGAIELFERARLRWTRAVGASHPSVGYVVHQRGRSELALGDRDTAIASFEQALTTLAPTDHEAVPDVQWSLARALVTSDHRRALELAESAAERYEEEARVELVDEVRGWIADRTAERGSSQAGGGPPP